MIKQQFLEREHAKIYSRFRPDIPLEIAEKVTAHLQAKFKGALQLAVDLGCGSGQSTVILASFFKKVIGIDVSSAQIEEAKRSRSRPNIIYEAGLVEKLPFADNSVQLVTSCAAFHWFEKERIFPEIRRILQPDGVFACYTYHFVKPLSDDSIANGKIQALFSKKCKELLPYFSKEVLSSLKKYEDVNFPFEEVIRPNNVRQIADGTLSDVLGYIESLSGFQNMAKEDPAKAEKFMSNFSERKSASQQICL